MSKVPGEVATSSSGRTSGDGPEVCDFETAIAACGFGCFNVCLMIASITTAISVLNSASAVSFILPIAESDLKLSLMDKGYLNAVSFAGMIFSAIPWGYIADTMGRKIVMVYSLLLDGVVVMGCGISQTFSQLLILKFFDGFLICGAFAVLMSYVSEFHGVKQRARMLMIIGMNLSAASIVLPILAICILPLQLSLEIFSLQINNWHIFLLATAMVPFFGGILNSLFPESPKFLMSQGRNIEALDCLRTIYAINHRGQRDKYPLLEILHGHRNVAMGQFGGPNSGKSAQAVWETVAAELNACGPACNTSDQWKKITNLVDEDPEKSRQHSLRSSLEYKATHNTMADKREQVKQQFTQGLQQLRPMLSGRYLKQSIHVYCIFFCIHLSFNAIRLWLPQIFATLEEFEAKKLGDSTMCTVLQYNYNKTILLEFDNNTSTSTSNFHYDLEHISISSFVDNLIVAIASFIFYLIAIVVINKLGSNMVLHISLGLAFFAGVTLYFSHTRLLTLVLASIYIGVSSVAITTVIYNSVNLFPTQMRTMVIIMMMTFGRLGSLLGNIIFPFLISLGCMPAFLQIGGVLAVAFILSLFLPNTGSVALK